ncbi:hypothetical protein DDB_G0277189 [Dictyostelium discoideum AX4]|uniref:Ubiquitin-like domain-containing protein n=1 Tax=Dictyostelium discoideum TaxID=44689 RepID=Q86K69_DICDI|nr:hypothetical protein DDB_G0277189 [Dictyostelium discoideum AX4]EAL68780.1 hypothetical protein DDB_G0277189 [Dictyostelium discoideum AX4]|eukprot:XP_642716.1 hypothetical protein DDB_G0277189 [Dictyostelium discoideum AX4]
MSLYFRIKRNEQTIFLSAEPNDTILKLKNDVANINKLTDGNISEYIRFFFGGSPLDDKKTISQLHVPNDSIIFMYLTIFLTLFNNNTKYTNSPYKLLTKNKNNNDNNTGDSYEEIAPSLLNP